jgi:sugar phosphate isomerase/epimerase
MHNAIARRQFLACAGAAAAGLGFGSLAGRLVHGADGPAKVKISSPTAAKMGWLVGCQLYTYRRYSFFEALEHIAALGIAHVEPCFFLGLDKARPELKTNEDLPADVRKELKKRLADRGIAMSAFYANLGTDKDRAVKIFEFCAEMGTSTIVAEPPAEAFDMIDTLCQKYSINVAVHNHPESPQSKYWKPENVLAVCKDRSKRIGACCDTGHWVRSGLDPVECLKKLEGRILGFHLKDVAEKGNRQSRDVPLGQGQANYAAVLAELRRQGYRGVMTIEYEHDSPALDDDVAKCVAFVEETAKKFAT